MAKKQRNLFFYLALASFLGLIAVYFVDGYMGLYDTARITAGERKQISIELYQWLETGGTWTAEARWGEEVKFEYEISNRQFSTYSADVQVSLYQNQEKVSDLVSQHIAVAPFGKEQLKWVLDTVELEPGGAPPPAQFYQYMVIIKNGETERKITFYIYRPLI